MVELLGLPARAEALAHEGTLPLSVVRAAGLAAVATVPAVTTRMAPTATATHRDEGINEAPHKQAAASSPRGSQWILLLAHTIDQTSVPYTTRHTSSPDAYPLLAGVPVGVTLSGLTLGGVSVVRVFLPLAFPVPEQAQATREDLPQLPPWWPSGRARSSSGGQVSSGRSSSGLSRLSGVRLVTV